MRSLLRSTCLFVALLATGVARAQDGSFTNAGLELHYTSAGAGQPVVFLGGGPGLDVNYFKPAADLVPHTCRRIFSTLRLGPTAVDRWR